MKIKISTTDHWMGVRMVKCVTNRDTWTGKMSGGSLGDLDFYGLGLSMKGRSVEATLKFHEGQGTGVLEIEAPASKGGFLATMLEELEEEHEIRYDGASAPDRSPEPKGLAVEIDGRPAQWDWVEIPTGGIWWKTAK